ncbi:Uncharacterised protein [Mycobacterium tuberculosis]|nr:Uncharacterised protein [Mycobacterium tuberculosis]
MPSRGRVVEVVAVAEFFLGGPLMTLGDLLVQLRGPIACCCAFAR